MEDSIEIELSQSVLDYFGYGAEGFDGKINVVLCSHRELEQSLGREPNPLELSNWIRQNTHA